MSGLGRRVTLSALAGVVAAGVVIGAGGVVAHADEPEPVPVVEVTGDPAPDLSGDVVPVVEVTDDPAPDLSGDVVPVVVSLEGSQLLALMLALGILVIAASAAFVTSVGGRRA